MKKMLVGLDGSPRQEAVLDAAIALGRKTGAKLVLFRSIGMPHDLPPEVYAMAPQEIPQLLQRTAQEAMAKIAQRVPPELSGGIRVEIGIAWQAIGRVADEEDVDLIVIGSHGYDTFDRLIGTTSAKVVNHADRSVLVVRAPERFARE